MLFLDILDREEGRIAAGSLDDGRDLQTTQLDPPDNHIGRRELMLTDLVTSKENLWDLVETEEFLDKIQVSYSKQNALKNVLENLDLFTAFRVKSGFIACLNDLGEPHLVLPEVIHKGERIAGIMIENAHKILGHLGFQKTLEYIWRYYWWSTMVKDMEKLFLHVKSARPLNGHPNGWQDYYTNYPSQMPQWMSITMDFIGPFPKSFDSNYLWVIVCHLTSQVHLVPIKMTTNALELTYEFLKNIVHLHGLPKSIVSDRDSKFTSKFWTELHHLLGVRLKMTTSFHPQGDGQAKWTIQTIIQIIWATV